MFRDPAFAAGSLLLASASSLYSRGHFIGAVDRERAKGAQSKPALRPGGGGACE